MIYTEETKWWKWSRKCWEVRFHHTKSI